MRCLSRISRGTPFPSLSRQERGTDTRGVSYFSGDIFFFLLGAIRIWSRCPAPIYTGQRDKPKQSGHPAGQLRDALPENRWYPPISLSRFCGTRGTRCGTKPKKLVPQGGGVRDKKEPVPQVVPGPFRKRRRG